MAFQVDDIGLVGPFLTTSDLSNLEGQACLPSGAAGAEQIALVDASDTGGFKGVILSVQGDYSAGNQLATCQRFGTVYVVVAEPTSVGDPLCVNGSDIVGQPTSAFRIADSGGDVMWLVCSQAASAAGDLIQAYVQPLGTL